MKKLLLTLIVSFALCGSIFAQYETHWPYVNLWEDHSDITAAIAINGHVYTVDDEGWDALEVAFFVLNNGTEEIRGSGNFLDRENVDWYDDPYPITPGSVIRFTDPGETVYFKLFDHINQVEYDVCEVTYLGEPIEIITGTDYLYAWNDEPPYDPVILNFIGEEPQPASFTKEIEGYGDAELGGYYLIASPIMEETIPSVENGFITDDLGLEATPETSTYDFYWFNQGEDLEWQNYRVSPFNVVSGKGYLYASKAGTTLTFTGTPYSGDGAIELVYDASAEFPGFNLVGNPFTEAAAPDRDYYILNDGGMDIMTDPSTELVPPMEGCFVFAEEDGEFVTFSTEAKGQSSLIALNISSAGKVVDRAIVRFGQGRMLPKFQLNPNSTKIYVTLDGNDYAVVRSEGMGELPLSFKAERNGEFNMTLSTENVDFAYLHLIDNLTGADQDLLANPSYAFNASTTDYANRFRLVFATGNDDDTFAFFSNGSLFVNNEGNATLQVVDVTGRIIKSESINGCANLNIDAAPGVYMVRLVNGDNIKVQKVVK
jgi:hypothetical protein